MALTPEEEARLLTFLKASPSGGGGFDLSTAQPVEDEFDLSTAQPVEAAGPDSNLPSFGDLRITPLGPPLKEYPAIAANAFNAAGAGIPGELYRRLTGQPIPQPQSLPGKFLNFVGEGAGLIAGVPGVAGRLAGGVAGYALPRLASSALGRGALRGIEGGVLGVAANLPNTIRNPQQGAVNAATGAVLNVSIPPAINAVNTLAGDIYRVTQTPLRAQFVDSIRNAFLQSKKLAGETFGTKIDTLAKKFPAKTIDVSGIVGEVQQRSLTNPAFKSLVMRGVRNDQESVLMQSILNQPDTAQNLTLHDAQAVKQVFSRALKQKFNQVSPEYTDAHLDALDIWHELRAAQLEAFPEFADIAAGYRKAITNFRTVKPYLTKAALEPNLLNNFGNKSEIMQSVNELLPKETLKEIERFIRAALVVRGTGKLAFYGAVGAAGALGAGAVAKPIIDSIRR